MEKLYTVIQTRQQADNGLDREILIAKFKLKLRKVGKTTRPLSQDYPQGKEMHKGKGLLSEEAL